MSTNEIMLFNKKMLEFGDCLNPSFENKQYT